MLKNNTKFFYAHSDIINDIAADEQSKAFLVIYTLRHMFSGWMVPSHADLPRIRIRNAGSLFENHWPAKVSFESGDFN